MDVVTFEVSFEILKKMMLLKLILVFLIPSTVLGHPGGLDKSGGHTNRKTSEYHCHKEPCSTIHRQVDEATQEAIQEQRPVSLLYRREDWKHWIDADGDCMNTRHEILLQQAVGEVKLSPDGCFVSMGAWNDPYSGKRFTRASDLDIDHVIAVKWAHEHGGANWPPEKKEAFANDPLNLLAVDDGLNQAKGAKGPDQWLPPNQAYRCQYLDRWKRVLSAYPGLTMTPQENRIYGRQLSACGIHHQ